LHKRFDNKSQDLLFAPHVGESKTIATNFICGKEEVKLRCDERFTHAFTACVGVFKVITLV
jgi:hypothetical protein